MIKNILYKFHCFFENAIEKNNLHNLGAFLIHIYLGRYLSDYLASPKFLTNYRI